MAKIAIPFKYAKFLQYFFTYSYQTEEILLFPEIDPNGHPCKLEVCSKLIFKVVTIRNLNIIREIGKKGKTRHPSW